MLEHVRKECRVNLLQVIQRKRTRLHWLPDEFSSKIRGLISAGVPCSQNANDFINAVDIH